MNLINDLNWEYNKQIMHKTNTHRHAAAAVAAAAAPVALLFYKNIIYVIFYTHAYKNNSIKIMSTLNFMGANIW